MDSNSFREDVYNIVREIPFGNVSTYKQIALLAGFPLHSRMVGHTLSCVPPHLKLPCHRVVSSQGRLVPSWTEQRALLESEGIRFRSNGCVDIKHFLWNP